MAVHCALVRHWTQRPFATSQSVSALQPPSGGVQAGTHAPARPWAGSQTAPPLQLALLAQPQTPGPPSATQLGADAGQAALDAHAQVPLLQVSLPGQSLEETHSPQAPWEQPGRAGGQSEG